MNPSDDHELDQWLKALPIEVPPVPFLKLSPRAAKPGGLELVLWALVAALGPLVLLWNPADAALLYGARWIAAVSEATPAVFDLAMAGVFALGGYALSWALKTIPLRD